MMTCDDVFEVLTLPAASVDRRQRGDLQRHLECCTSCARLAEAISPAVELFAQAAEEISRASVYAAPPIDWLAAARASDSASAPRPLVRSATDPSWQAMRLAVTLLIGVTLGGMLYGHSSLNSSSDNAASLPSSRTRNVSLPSSQLTRLALESLSLTEACLPHGNKGEPVHLAKRPAMPAWDLLAQVGTHELACCTHCHSTLGSAGHERDAIAEVAKSCQNCHVQ
jgi:hypothetical protein